MTEEEKQQGPRTANDNGSLERYDFGRYPMYEEDGYRLLLFSTERAICAAAGLAVPHRGR
jgi:hypothetical protein